MPWYNDLRPKSDNKKQEYALLFPDMKKGEKKRTIKNLLKLRQDLEEKIPYKSNDKNLLISSWNIKEFGQMTNRLPESYFYIAEILSQFDLIAVQEIKNRLEDLSIIMRLLGSNWDYLINDMTGGTAGNMERFAYIYDKRRVNFSGLAGEIVLWDEISSARMIRQLKRTPFITGFKAGWKSFAIINVHLNPGNDADSRKLRKQEIEALVDVIKEKISKKQLWTDNLMVMGDFNIYSDNEDMIDVLTANGFLELQSLVGQPTNVSGTQAYDKIFYRKNKYFNITNEEGDNGGVLKFFDSIYPDTAFQSYKSYMKDHKEDPSTLNSNDAYKSYYDRYWKRNQMSDHYPIWIEMQIDHSDEFLAEKLKEF